MLVLCCSYPGVPILQLAGWGRGSFDLHRGAAMADATKAEFRAILEKYMVIDFGFGGIFLWVV